MTRFFTEIQGRSFKLDEDLLSKIKQAKNFLEPKKEREIRLTQLFNHKAKTANNGTHF